MNLNRFIYLFQGCWAAKVTKKECRSKQNDTHFRALIFVSRSNLYAYPCGCLKRQTGRFPR